NLRLPLNPPFFAEADAQYDRTTGPGTISKGFTDVIVRDKPAGFICAEGAHNATHLVAPTDWNQPLPGTGDPSTWVNFNLRRPLSGVLPAVTQISGTESWSVSRYNALQVNGRQRFSKGFEYLLAYTWSKTMTDNLGYYGSGGVAAQGAYSANNYDRHG